MWEKTIESPLNCKEIKPVHPKGNQSWIFIGSTDAEAPILRSLDAKNWLFWKRPWCWERLKAGEKWDNRGWDGCLVSPTRWRWVWTSSRSWWWMGKPGMLQSMGSQRVSTTESLTELNWILDNSSESDFVGVVKVYRVSVKSKSYLFVWYFLQFPIKISVN